MDKILKVAKRLKTFTLEDIAMFCEVDAETAGSFLLESENIKASGDKFEYVETVRTEDKFKIINKNIPCKNSDITVTDACISFLNVSQIRNIKQNTVKAYKTFINAHIIPYFKGFVLKDITVSDVESFRKCMQHKQISERRIKIILTLLNQIIKYFDNNPKAGSLYSVMPVLFNYFQNLMIAHYAPDKRNENALASYLDLPRSWAVKEYLAGLRNYSAGKVFAIIHKIKEIYAASKGIHNVSTSAGDLAKEMLFFILH